MQITALQRFLAMSIIFSFNVSAEIPPIPPTELGQLTPEGTSQCLSKLGSLQTTSQLLDTCVPSDPLVLQSTLYGGDASLTVKDSVGTCLVPNVPSTVPANSYFDAYFSCGNNPNNAKYDPTTKQIYSAMNGGLCLAAVLRPNLTQQGGAAKWVPLFVPCNTVGTSTNPVITKWNFTSYPNAPKATPSLVNVYGQCLQNLNLFGAQQACGFGNPNQYWVYNSNHQITNGQGQCLTVDQNSSTVVDTCTNDAKHQWDFVATSNLLKNVATQACLDSTGSTASTCLAVNDPLSIYNNWYLIAQPQTQPPTNNLVAKNDSYGAVSSPFYNQLVFDTPAAKGVRANDTPTGWPAGLTFEVVDQIKHTTGGQATAELFFRDTGGFYVMLRSNAKTASARMADKRGTYQFIYKMAMNGQYSAPATVTLSVY